MSIKTVLSWVALTFVVWWVIMQPHAAATSIHNVGVFLSNATAGFNHFFATL